MITDLKVNEKNKKEYYEKGYWTERTLNDIWNTQVAAFPDREYVSDNLGVRYTYAEIDDKASRLAAWLHDVGVKTATWFLIRCHLGQNSASSTLPA